MSAKSAHQRWHEWRLRVVSDSNQHENVKQRQREQKRKERATFKEQASNAQLEAKRAADRERQRRRRARLRAAREIESTLVGNYVPVNGTCGKPKVVQNTTSQRAHSHSKSSARPSMKISVNGLISAKKGHRFPEHRSNGTEATESHTWNSLNGHDNPTPGRTDAAMSNILQKSPLSMDTKFTSSRYSAKNNNLPSFSPTAVPSKDQPYPEQDQPLCLKKTTPSLTHVIDRDFKRTLMSPSEHVKKMNPYSSNSWDGLDLSSRKRSRKQSQPLKYVALN